MARNPGCTVFIGNLDDRVPERVLYEILIQISGQDKVDKPSSNGNMPVTPRLNPIPAPKPPQLMRSSDTPSSQHTVVNGRIAGYGISPNHSYDSHSQAPSSGLPSRGLSNGTYEYSRRVFGSVMNDVSRRATREPVPYPSY
ncbi:uncharacterized protein LOC101777550 isoform X2 [Setaria italica]|nr:uncharacterized protein LOC101777550 isoform X2 [Setaria italica]XP_034587101.1 uncharacterized protein LOC117849602 isoform X2 [Setaria viridis]